MCKPERKEEIITTHHFFFTGIRWVLVRKHEGRRPTGACPYCIGMPVMPEPCGETEAKYARIVDPSLILRQKPSRSRRKARNPPWASLRKTSPLLEETQNKHHLLLGMGQKTHRYGGPSTNKRRSSNAIGGGVGVLRPSIQ